VRFHCCEVGSSYANSYTAFGTISLAGKTSVSVGLFGNVSAVDDVMMSVASAVGTPVGRASDCRFAENGNVGVVDGGVGCTVSVSVDVAAPAFVGAAKLSVPESTIVVGGNCSVIGAFVPTLTDEVADDEIAGGTACVFALDPQCARTTTLAAMPIARAEFNAFCSVKCLKPIILITPIKHNRHVCANN
jgi:hypothetical protein